MKINDHPLPLTRQYEKSFIPNYSHKDKKKDEIIYPDTDHPCYKLVSSDATKLVKQVLEVNSVV